MKLSIEHLIDDTMALVRFLTVITFDFANQSLAMVEATRREELASGPHLDQWRRIIKGDDVGFILESKDGSGRYSRVPPPELDSNTIRTVYVDPTAQPALKLFNELSDLIIRLSSGSRITIPNTNEQIELLSHPENEQHLAALQLYLEGTKTAISPGYNEKIIGCTVELFRENVLSVGQIKTDQIRDWLQKCSDDVANLRSLAAADGSLAGWFLFYRDACLEVEKQCRTLSNENKPSGKLLRIVNFGSGGIRKEPLWLIERLTQKMSREGLYLIVKELGKQYLTRGEQFVEQALASQSIDTFRGALYTAGLFLFTGDRIFRSLLAQDPNPVPDEDLDFIRQASTVADEKLVRVGNSCQFAVENRTGERLRYHQWLLEKAREKGGEKAALQQVFELTEMHYFYPRYFEKKLMGAT
ncbi:MAG: hypothetical protein KC643_21890 [Nitrospira sp.]|nr:hypothetical protein [Nitrospira sp.]